MRFLASKAVAFSLSPLSSGCLPPSISVPFPFRKLILVFGKSSCIVQFIGNSEFASCMKKDDLQPFKKNPFLQMACFQGLTHSFGTWHGLR
jgi:hypothetical protein